MDWNIKNNAETYHIPSLAKQHSPAQQEMSPESRLDQYLE